MSPIAIELVRDGFHLLDKSPRRNVDQPAIPHVDRLSDPAQTDAITAIVPLFNKLIAPQHGAGQDIAAFVAAKHNEPVEYFRQFYTAFSRAMLHKFAECCERKAKGGSVDREIAALKGLYQTLVSLAPVTARPVPPGTIRAGENRRYKGSVYFCPANIPNGDAFYAGCDALFKAQLDTDAQPSANPVAVPPVPKPAYQHFIVPPKSAPIIPTPTAGSLSPAELWQNVQAHERGLRNVSIADLSAFVANYSAKKFSLIFNGMSHSQCVHFLRSIGDPNQRITIPQPNGKPDLSVNCVQALAYAAKRSKQPGADHKLLCRIANMALAQLMPDETIVLSAQRLRVPASGVSNPSAATIPLWRDRSGAVPVPDPVLAADRRPHNIAQTEERSDVAEEVRQLTASPADTSRVYFGTPAQVGPASDLAKRLSAVAVDGGVVLPSDLPEVKLVPTEIDALMAVALRKSHVRHYQGEKRPATNVKVDVRWIPGAGLVQGGINAGELDQAALEQAISTAVSKKGGRDAISRILMVVQLGSGDEQRYVTIALDWVGRDANVLVVDPLGEKADDAKAIKAALKQAIENAGQSRYYYKLSNYGVTSKKRAAVYEGLAAGDDGILAYDLAERLSRYEQGVEDCDPDRCPSEADQASIVKQLRRNQYGMIKRIVSLSDDDKQRLVSPPLDAAGVIDCADANCRFDANGKLTQAAFDAYARPLGYQVAQLPDPSGISYPSWIDESNLEEKQSFEATLVQHNIANLYFLLAQGKQVRLPAKDADGHYQLMGVTADSWMHKHQGLIDTHLDRFAALAAAMNGSRYSAQREALMQMHEDKPAGCMAYLSAFIAGESSDAVGLDQVNFDDIMQADIKSANGEFVDHMCYQPQAQLFNVAACQRGVPKGEHILPVDERAIEDMRSQRHRRSATRRAVNLQQNLKMAYAMVFKAADREVDADYGRFETKLRELLGDDGFDRLMSNGVNSSVGSAVMSEAEIDACFAAAYGRDNVSKQRALAIKKSLLKPGDVGKYYSHLVRTIGQQLQIDIKDDAEFKNEQGETFASFEELYLAGEYRKADDGRFTDERNPDHGSFGSLEELYAARGGSITSPSQALYTALPQHVLSMHLTRMAVEHNAKQTASKDKTKVVNFDCGEHGGVDAGFTQLTSDIRRYLHSANPSQGQQFFSVLLRSNSVSTEGHYVSVAVNHAERTVTVIDPRADDAEFDPAESPHTTSKLFQRRAQQLQYDLRHVDPVSFAPAIDDVAVVNYSQPVDGFDGFTPQRRDETFCGDHAVAMLHAVMNKGTERSAAITSQRQAELAAVQAVTATSLGSVVEPLPITAEAIIKASLSERGLASISWADDDTDLSALSEGNLAKLEAYNQSLYRVSRWYAGDIKDFNSLLTVSGCDISGLTPAELPVLMTRLADLKNKVMPSVAPFSQEAVRQLRAAVAGIDPAITDLLVASPQVSTQKASLLVNNKRKMLSADGQSMLSARSWYGATWRALRGLVGRGDDAAAAVRTKQKLGKALAQACADAGVDLSKVENLDALPESVKHALRYAAKMTLSPVITQEDLAEQATVQGKLALVTERNRTEYNNHREFWPIALDVSPAAIDASWLPVFNGLGVDLAALRSDPQSPVLLSHFVSAHKKLHSIGHAPGTPYVQRQQIQQKYQALGVALHDYQCAVRESTAYAGGDVAEQQRLLNAVDSSFAAFKRASTSFQQQTQQAAAARNRVFVAAAAPASDFISVIDVLKRPGESPVLFKARFVACANANGVDLRALNWSAAVTAADKDAVLAALPGVKNILSEMVKAPTLEQQPPRIHAWNKRPVAAREWRTARLNWKQQLHDVGSPQIASDKVDWGHAQFVAAVQHLAPELPQAAADPVLVADVPARAGGREQLRQDNRARLESFSDVIAGALNGSLPQGFVENTPESLQHRQLLADFATAMGLDLTQVDDDAFDRVGLAPTRFENNGMHQLMQLAAPFMAMNGIAVDVAQEQLLDPSVEEARHTIHPTLATVIVGPSAGLAQQNSQAVNDALFTQSIEAAVSQPPQPQQVVALRAKLSQLASRAGISLQTLLPDAHVDPLAERGRKVAARTDLIDCAIDFELNAFEVTQRFGFYLEFCEHVNPVSDFNWRALIDDDDLADCLQGLADVPGIDLAVLRSTPQGMKVLNQWMQGVNVAAFQSYLLGEPMDEEHLNPKMQPLSQAVAAYQANPSDQAAQAVEEACQMLADSSKPLVTEFNCRVLLEYPLAHPIGDAAIAERELLIRVNNFIDAVLDQEAAESGLSRDAGGEDRRRLRTQLAAFLNAHTRPLPALDCWSEGNAAAIQPHLGDANNAPLCDMILSARDYYNATQPAETLDDTTVAQYQQRSQVIVRQAGITAGQEEIAFKPIPDPHLVKDIAVRPTFVATTTAGSEVSNAEHLAHASGMPEAATNADIWWQMLSKPGNDVCVGFQLAEADREDYLERVQNFCGADINLNALAYMGSPSAGSSRDEFQIVVQQMLRIVVQQKHGIYPVQSQAQLATYKQALAAYINAPDDDKRFPAYVVLHTAYRALTESVPAPTAAAPRHPRLQAYLQQQVAKHIMQHKALDTLLSQQYPGMEPEQLDLLRMQVLQYMQQFGITRFDFPTAETLSAAADAASPSYAEANDVVGQWQGIVGQAIAYDATLIAGRRLGVAHDDAAWNAFVATPLPVPAGAPGSSTEIKSVIPIPDASLARMLAAPGEAMTPADQIDQRLTRMFAQDLLAPYAPPALAADIQPHVLLARLDGQGAHGADHAAARASIIRAVMLTQMARHVGVTLNDAAQEHITTVLRAACDQLDAGGAIDISANSDALLAAYVTAADANPELKLLLVPAPEQTTAAERLAQLRTQQAGRPADVYDGIDPRPGTEAYRHQLLQQMRHDAADAAGGLDATQQVPDEDIADAEDLDALRRRTDADHALSEEHSLRQQVIDKYRMSLRFLDDNGELTADLKAMFVDNLVGGSESREGYEHYPEDHKDKNIFWNETLPTGFRLNVDRCTVNTLYFEPPVHSTQSGLSVMRSVGTDGGVTFKLAELGTGGANNTAKARIYAAMLAREFYRKDNDGKMHAVGIDIKAFKAKDIFGDNCGLSEPAAQKILQDALEAFHIANEDMVVGKGKLHFAEDPSKKPKPKPGESKESKTDNAAAVTQAVGWANGLTDAQLQAQRLNPAMKPQLVQQLQANPPFCAQLMAKPEAERLPFLVQTLQQAQQQQAAANGGAQPPAGGRAAPPPPDGAAAAGPTP
ncbi:MAG: hypothetical protein P1U40_01850 [Coxiellaceae bacterium]|nr:hypothetical protein [Coxiellaceae bacterium]